MRSTFRYSSSLAAASAFALAACGANSAASVERAPAAKAAGVGGEAAAAALASAPSGLRAPSEFDEQPEVRLARSGDVSLRAFGTTPVGVIDREHARDYALQVELRNTSDDVISFERISVHSSVYEDDRLVRGCGGSAPELVTASRMVLLPGQAFLISHPLPCALEESARYDVMSVVMIGLPGRAAGLAPRFQFREAVGTPLVVDADLPPFGADEAAHAEAAHVEAPAP